MFILYFDFRTPEATHGDHAAGAEETASSFLAKAIHSMEENANSTIKGENNIMPEAGDFTESGKFYLAGRPAVFFKLFKKYFNHWKSACYECLTTFFFFKRIFRGSNTSSENKTTNYAGGAGPGFQWILQKGASTLRALKCNCQLVDKTRHLVLQIRKSWIILNYTKMLIYNDLIMSEKKHVQKLLSWRPLLDSDNSWLLLLWF